MRRENPLVSIGTKSRRSRSKPSEALLSSNAPTIEPLITRNRSDRSVIGSGIFLVNLSRLLVPLLVLISTTRCATTTSLSPLGLYKVGIGATNLVENILNTKSKAVTLETTESITSTEHESGLDKQSNKTRNNNDHNNKNNKRKKKNKNSVTNKTRRRDKNKHSIKRSNSEIKRKKTPKKSPNHEHKHNQRRHVSNSRHLRRRPKVSGEGPGFFPDGTKLGQ
mmetsp:Transcript_16053/g.40254  ORF Transcript_16053/g.40254 Transcript_16053/m.40254 type:complete len:222 (+) Transcript_16053:157-822(+)